jgi:phage terminase Nu1 subunit (DNA packaging protein)
MARPRTIVSPKAPDPERQLAGALGARPYVEEKAALVRVQRELAELKLAKERGELVEVKAMQDDMSAVFTNVRMHLLAIGPAIAPSLVGLGTPAEAERIVSKAITHALRELAAIGREAT